MARRRRLETLTGWSMMWIICMFDIPVRTRKEMRKATRFRNVLLDEGFVMKQFSVYIKPVKSLSAGQTVTKRLSRFIPDNSSVSFLYITDKQYLMTENYLGKNYEENECFGLYRPRFVGHPCQWTCTIVERPVQQGQH